MPIPSAPSALQALLLVHLAATWCMVGVTWTVQLVVYPAFSSVGAGTFTAYHRGHTRRMSALLALPWGLEVVTAALLVIVPLPGVPRWLPLLGAALLALIVGVTVAVAVPCHSRLADGFDPAVHRRLLASHGLRTAAWTARGALAVILLILGLRGLATAGA